LLAYRSKGAEPRSSFDLESSQLFVDVARAREMLVGEEIEEFHILKVTDDDLEQIRQDARHAYGANQKYSLEDLRKFEEITKAIEDDFSHSTVDGFVLYRVFS